MATVTNGNHYTIDLDYGVRMKRKAIAFDFKLTKEERAPLNLRML